jgi:hypothetical protein
MHIALWISGTGKKGSIGLCLQPTWPLLQTLLTKSTQCFRQDCEFMCGFIFQQWSIGNTRHGDREHSEDRTAACMKPNTTEGSLKFR